MEEMHYSVVLRPSESVIDSVRNYKQLLAQSGNYGSKNAEAHITILEFFAREQQIAIVEQYMARCASTIRDFVYRFDSYGSFRERNTKENGVFFIAPDEDSSTIMYKLSSQFYEHFPLKGKVRAIPSGRPHMTIGRRLQQHRVEAAYELFADERLDLACSCTLALRVKRINFPEQFRVQSEFAFNGLNMDFGGSQTRLFA